MISYLRGDGGAVGVDHGGRDGVERAHDGADLVDAALRQQLVEDVLRQVERRGRRLRRERRRPLPPRVREHPRHVHRARHRRLQLRRRRVERA